MKGGWGLLILFIGWSQDLVKEERVRKNDESKTILRDCEDSGAATKLKDQEESMFEENRK